METIGHTVKALFAFYNDPHTHPELSADGPGHNPWS
jgi:hypothetical protein